jgi:hypothetical protein
VKPYYEHAGITIYHGDSRDVLPVECDLIVSDPPYGARLDTGKLNRIGAPARYEWHGVEDWGGVDVARILAMGKPTVLFGANFFSSLLPDHGGWIVWDKQTDGFAQGSPAELAWSNYLRNLRMSGSTTAGSRPAGTRSSTRCRSRSCS